MSILTASISNLSMMSSYGTSKLAYATLHIYLCL